MSAPQFFQSLQSLSLYTLSATHNALAGITQTTSVPSLLAISHSIEETVMQHGLDSYFFAGFQRMSSFLPQANRFHLLASRCRQVFVFGVPDAPMPEIPNLTYITLNVDAPLSKEWFIVFTHPRFSIALLTNEIGISASDFRDNNLGRGRLYQGFVTLEDHIVSPAARALRNALNLTNPQINLPPPDPFPPINSYLNHFAEYMERAQSQLRALYQNLQERTAALQRVESIVRTMISKRAWDDSVKMTESPVHETPQAQRRLLSILFTDIQNFTPIFERSDPLRLTEQLNRYFNLLATIVYENHGDIDKFLGDGLMAFFFDPQTAVHAAREIQHRLQIFNQQQAAHQQLHFNTRIGIASGECIIARLGSNTRREVTILGDPVNLASRLQAVAPPNGVALDEITYKAIGNPPQCFGREMNIKGKGYLRVYTADLPTLNQLPA